MSCHGFRLRLFCIYLSVSRAAAAVGMRDVFGLHFGLLVAPFFGTGFTAVQSRILCSLILCAKTCTITARRVDQNKINSSHLLTINSTGSLGPPCYSCTNPYRRRYNPRPDNHGQGRRQGLPLLRQDRAPLRRVQDEGQGVLELRQDRPPEGKDRGGHVVRPCIQTGAVCVPGATE